ncbi:Beta-galactosidase [Chitinophaga rupis]|uniref:Beta-galactosidase n=1 Tax=Chitinophaga rupis TaxID=573321 RepID=A0A1H7LQ81_9BACT|nr:beta-galactosidase [Chitinophaga rupis]SEL01124.1 Beta-galactosidase [Chitinophaga rupis]
MKHSFVIIIAVLLLTFKGSFTFAQWKQNEFIIGTFADPNLSKPANEQKDIAAFTRAKDAYFNLLTGPQFFTGASDFSMMDRELNIARKTNLKLLMIDSRMYITRDTFNNNKADLLIDHFKSKDTDYKDALYGYNFGGEFPKQLSPNVKKWAGYFKEKHPGKLVYTYLLPRYAFNSDAAYEDYVDGYLKSDNGANAIDIAAFDFYPFIGGDKVRDKYFYNLDVIQKKSGTRPFWVYVLTTKHLVYPDPDEYQLNFMSFCPIAYGAKGLIYFTYETLPKGKVDFGEGLIDRNGRPTPKYYIAQRNNHYIHDILGPIVMSSQLMETDHVSNEPTLEDVSDQLLTRKNKYIKKINDDNILVGIFKKGTEYNFIVINKARNPVAGLNITLSAGLGSQYFLSPALKDYKGQADFTVTTPALDKARNAIIKMDLSGGEIRVIKVKG